MQTAIFLFSNLTGHLNPTIKLADFYKKEGFNIFYCGLTDLIIFTQKHDFNHYSFIMMGNYFEKQYLTVLYGVLHPH